MSIQKLGLIAVALTAFSAPAFAQGDAVAGAAVFKRCASCHAVGEGAKNKVGPELNGIVGRVAGTAPDYKYSQAMIDAGTGGVTWTSEELHIFLENPKALVAGTKMSFPGLKKPAERDNVIAYLETFAADGTPAPAQ